MSRRIIFITKITTCLIYLVGNEVDESDAQYDISEVSQEEQRFEIKRPLLPTCISQRLAEKILFIGESVYRFSTPKNSLTQAKFASPTKSSLGSAFRSKELIEGQEDAFIHELLLIEKDSQFWKRKLEVLLDSLHSTVNRALSHLFVEERNLVAQLRRIRDLYLLGRGELFLYIFDTMNLHSKENKDLSKIDPNSIFKDALVQLKCENIAQTGFLKFCLCRKSLGELGSDKLNQISELFNAETDENEILNNLSISCTSVEWPLRVLLTPTVLNQYEALFRFLLRIKHSQWKLYQIWLLKRGYQTQSSAPHIDKQRLARDFTNVWEVHHKMRFFTDCLQYYIFSDVLEVHYTFLIEKIRSTDNFDTILLAHQQFLSEVMNKLFFNNFPIFNAIFQALRLIDRFYKTQLGQHSIGKLNFSNNNSSSHLI